MLPHSRRRCASFQSGDQVEMSERRQVAAEQTRSVPRARPEEELDGGQIGGGGRRIAASSGAEHDDGHLLGLGLGLGIRVRVRFRNRVS